MGERRCGHRCPDETADPFGPAGRERAMATRSDSMSNDNQQDTDGPEPGRSRDRRGPRRWPAGHAL